MIKYFLGPNDEYLINLLLLEHRTLPPRVGSIYKIREKYRTRTARGRYFTESTGSPIKVDLSTRLQDC